MSEYPSNSLKSKEEQQAQEERPKVEPVASGAKIKKKSEFRKFAQNFIADDAERVEGYLFRDVLVPIVKNTIQQLITKGTDYVLYGESGSGTKSSSVPKVSYGSYYNGSPQSTSTSTPSKQNTVQFDDIILKTRPEAEEVRKMLYELLDRYDKVTVADYYDLCQITAPFTANRYGWKDIGNCPVVRCREGFMLSLPRAIALDN